MFVQFMVVRLHCIWLSGYLGSWHVKTEFTLAHLRCVKTTWGNRANTYRRKTQKPETETLITLLVAVVACRRWVQFKLNFPLYFPFFFVVFRFFQIQIRMLRSESESGIIYPGCVCVKGCADYFMAMWKSVGNRGGLAWPGLAWTGMALVTSVFRWKTI